MTDTTLTPSRLWKRMTVDQRQRAARAFWQEPEAADDQIQAALLIAQQKKFRAKTVISHENGLIKDDAAKPDAAKLAPAADQISKQFPADDVRLYFDTLRSQDPET